MSRIAHLPAALHQSHLFTLAVPLALPRSLFAGCVFVLPSFSPDEGNNNGEVHAFWYASDNAVHSAKLAGSLVGAERDAFFAEKQAFLTATELQEELTKAEAAKDAAATK